MTLPVIVLVIVVVVIVFLALTLHVVHQYEKGVVFRFGRVVSEKEPGLVFVLPVMNVVRKVSFRIVTMPIQSQGPTSPHRPPGNTPPPTRPHSRCPA